VKLTLGGVFELNNGFEGSRVSQRHEPEEFGAAACFVQVHFDRFFLLLEHLALMRTRSAMQVEETVAVSTQIAAFATKNDGHRFPIVMIVASGLQGKTNDERQLL
jgi:hypothetical protein